MWLNCTCARVEPEYLGRAMNILMGEASMEPVRTARGFLGLCLVESTEIPGELLVLTWWESASDGQTYLASPECQQAIVRVQAFLLRPLERHFYTVMMETGRAEFNNRQELNQRR